MVRQMAINQMAIRPVSIRQMAIRMAEIFKMDQNKLLVVYLFIYFFSYKSSLLCRLLNV